MNIRPVICRFTIPGEPQGKGRPIAGFKFGKGGTRLPSLRTPEKTVAYEGLIAHAAMLAMAGRAPVEEPVEIRVDIVCSVPASYSMKKTRDALVGLIRPAKKPDPDNVLKAVADGMNGVVWKDDVQAVDGSWSKRYGTTPGVTVTVMPVRQVVEQQAQADLLGAMA